MQPDEVYLNLVLEFVPETIYRIIKHYSRTKRQVPGLYVKLYMYQVARSLAYIHIREKILPGRVAEQEARAPSPCPRTCLWCRNTLCVL